MDGVVILSAITMLMVLVFSIVMAMFDEPEKFGETLVFLAILGISFFIIVSIK